MDLARARELAEEFIGNMAAGQLDLVIVDSLTMDIGVGWVFMYHSKRYLETLDFRYQLAGNAPLIVEKNSGAVHVTGTAHPIDYYVDRFRKTGRP